MSISPLGRRCLRQIATTPVSTACVSYTSRCGGHRSLSTGSLAASNGKDDGVDAHSADASQGGVAQRLSQKIFPDSKASLRPNPHLAPLFGHTTARKDKSASGGQNRRPTRDSTLPSSFSKELMALRNSARDPKLRQLYDDLGSAVVRGNVTFAIDVCASIGQFVAGLPSSSSSDDEVPKTQMRAVYNLLLRSLGQHGLVAEAEAILLVMQRNGVEPNIDTLNHFLKAAVIVGDTDTIEEVLARIRSLPSDAVQPAYEPDATTLGSSFDRSKSIDAAKELFFRSGLSEGAGADKPAVSEHAPLSKEFTRNWTTETYNHLILSARASFNAEYGLTLMASALRDGVPLEHETFKQLIDLCLHVKEVRLAVELANDMERGSLARASSDDAAAAGKTSVARRLSPSMWMTILRECADAGYMPGIELAWQRSVVEGLLVPEGGLVLDALNAASSHGSVDFCRVLLRTLFRDLDALLSTGLTPKSHLIDAARGELQPWHLLPLFEAQCARRSFKDAIKVLSTLRKLGHPCSLEAVSYLTHSCYQDVPQLERAISALCELGSSKPHGVDVSAVNGLIQAAVWAGRVDLAVVIYERSWDLFDAVQPSRSDGRATVRAQEMANVVPAHKQGQSATSSSAVAGLRVRPNLDTFHCLFSGCIDTRDRELGRRLIADLNALGLEPSRLTYERMILLCLTQPVYDDAFGFIEQAKVNGIAPSRKSYEMLIRTCFSAHDERWRWLLDEMTEAKLFPGKALCEYLGIEFDNRPVSADHPRSRSRR